MKQSFFITGLPRSRTAWFAAFLSAHHDVWCWHEGLKGCRDKEEFRHKVEPWRLGLFDTETFVGNADSALALNPTFQEEYPDAPVVVIHRNPWEVSVSLEKMFGSVSRETHELIGETWVAMNKLRGFHVQYKDIDANMPSIMNHLGLEYRQDIHRLYTTFNIQTLDLAPDPAALAVWRG